MGAISHMEKVGNQWNFIVHEVISGKCPFYICSPELSEIVILYIGATFGWNQFI